MRFGMSRSHRVMMRERVRRESVVGNVCWPVVRRFVLFNWLVREPRCAVSLSRRATLVRHTLSGAQIKCIALALEPCHRPRISVAGPNVQLLTVLTGLVGVEQAEVLIEAFVDRRRGSPAATGREHEKAERETRAASKASLLPCSHIHVQPNTATLCLRLTSNADSQPSDACCAGPAVSSFDRSQSTDRLHHRYIPSAYGGDS
jgi:hypothetical protein